MSGNNRSRSSSSPWDFQNGEGAVIAAAVHHGHCVRESVLKRMVISEQDRLREEDPFTGDWTRIVDQRIVVNQSRFEYDLNRSRATCVYELPESAWGLNIYGEELPLEEKQQSLAEFDAFYEEALAFFQRIANRHPFFVVFDLHSYNHRRESPDGPEAASDGNPEINIGTGTMTQPDMWRSLVDRVIRDLRAYDYDGRTLDVRENVKFVGRNFGEWLHNTFPGQACCLSIECKKIFMDEWTGKLNDRKHALLAAAFSSSLPGIMDELDRLNRG